MSHPLNPGATPWYITSALLYRQIQVGNTILKKLQKYRRLIDSYAEFLEYRLSFNYYWLGIEAIKIVNFGITSKVPGRCPWIQWMGHSNPKVGAKISKAFQCVLHYILALKSISRPTDYCIQFPLLQTSSPMNNIHYNYTQVHILFWHPIFLCQLLSLLL